MQHRDDEFGSPEESRLTAQRDGWPDRPLGEPFVSRAGRFQRLKFWRKPAACVEELADDSETISSRLRRLVGGAAESGKRAFAPDRRRFLKDLLLLSLASWDIWERRTHAASRADEAFPVVPEPDSPDTLEELVEIATLFNAALPVPISLKTLPASRLPNALRAYRQGRHEGIDLYVPYGTPVLAIADGVVTRADRYFHELDPELHRMYLAESTQLSTTPTDILDYLRGRCVEIDHGVKNGVRWRSVYAHLSSVEVVAGARVIQGDAVAKVGNSGTTAGVRGSRDDAHLHLEIRMHRAGSGETYLGQGLSERQVRQLLEEVFHA